MDGSMDQLVTYELREEIALPVHFHTHDTSGLNAASVLSASDAGVDIVDLAIASMSGSTSQPNLNSVSAALAKTERDPGLDFDSLNEFSDYWEEVLGFYKPFDSAPRAGTAEVYEHEMPGGQYTNLREQANAMGLGHRRLQGGLQRRHVDISSGEEQRRPARAHGRAVDGVAQWLSRHLQDSALPRAASQA